MQTREPRARCPKVMVACMGVIARRRNVPLHCGRTWTWPWASRNKMRRSGGQATAEHACWAKLDSCELRAASLLRGMNADGEGKSHSDTISTLEGARDDSTAEATGDHFDASRSLFITSVSSVPSPKLNPHRMSQQLLHDLLDFTVTLATHTPHLDTASPLSSLFLCPAPAASPWCH